MIRATHKTINFIHHNFLHKHCKPTHIATARNLLDRKPVRHTTTWNSQLGSADRLCYIDALSACAGIGDLRKGRVIHGLAVTTGLYTNSFLTNSLIEMYSKCGKIDEARYAFDHAEDIDDVSWNSLFMAYVRIGWLEVAVDILVWMHRYGAKLNCIALRSVLDACKFGDANGVQRMIYGCVIKIGLDLDLMDNAVFDMYADNGGLDEVIKVFEHMPDRDFVVCNAMITGFSWLGTETCTEVRVEALRLYSEMLGRVMSPSKYIYKSVLRVCKLAREFKIAKQIHAHTILSNLRDDELVASALIELYSTLGLMEDGFKCFHSTKKESIDVWSSLISGYVLNEDFERALCLFVELLSIGRKPNEFLISSLWTVCTNLGLLRCGEQIQSHAMKAGLDMFTVCGNSQIDMYAKLGDLNAAIRSFEYISSLDVGSWSAVISSHAINGCETNALKFFEKMQEYKVEPNHITFLAVLMACHFGGLADEGFRYFESMQRDYNMTPTAEHLVCIVGLLGRSGRLAEAEDLLWNSGFTHEPLVWKVLLHSCQLHGDNERGIHVGERLMELEPYEATLYMQLYNMYLNVGKISLAMRTRGLMRERGVNRETSTCWIEIGGSVHTFAPGNCSHLQCDKIYERLEEMLLKIKHIGQDNVKILQLECGSEMWKQSLMNIDGDMLAFAIGMVSLPEQVPIRMMMNSTVSAECHTLLKLFSNSEGRKIVLRDSARIHHFTAGSCSCGEYW